MRPYNGAGVILQASPHAAELARFRFAQKGSGTDRHYYRHFEPADKDLEEVLFFGEVKWRGIETHIGGISLLRGYVYATVYEPSSSAPPPDAGRWNVQQYGFPVEGNLAIDMLTMTPISKEESEDFVREPANQAL